MATKKISEATNKTSLADTDMLPLAAAGDATAYKITGANLKASIPDATTSSKGIVELASAADIPAATANVVVECSALASAYAGTHYLAVGVSSPTYTALRSAFFTVFGRYPTGGEIVAVNDGTYYYLLVYYSAKFAGFRLDAGTFVSYT